MPEHPSHNIFLAVSGATPVVLTEAIWALAVKDGVRLDEIHVVTTPEGKSRLAAEGMFDEKNGPFARMRRDWKAKAKNIPAFTQASAHIPKGMRKKDLSDSDENACMEAEITGWLRRFTTNPSSNLYASLAGGRKTMSAYMILGMTAFARSQDHLYHVLSEAPGGSSPKGWYYPSPYKPAEKKWVNLFEVPFPKLRRTFELHHPELLCTSLTKAFESFNKSTEEPVVEVNLSDRRCFICVDGQPLRLEPKALLWLALLAHRKVTCGKSADVNCRECRDQVCRVETVSAGPEKSDKTKFDLNPSDVEFCKMAYGVFRSDVNEEDFQNPRFWASAVARMRKELPAQLGLKMFWFDSALARGAGRRSAGGILGIERVNLKFKAAKK